MSRVPPSAPLAPAGRIALPGAVETSAWAVPMAGGLRLLVNRPGAGATDQLHLHPSGEMEEMPPLPLVAAGAAACGGMLVATGSGPEGAPLAVGTAEDGGTAWRIELPGRPVRWPVPGCAPGPALAWQTAFDALRTAPIGPGGIGAIRSVPVGGPPLDVAVGEGAVWAAWAAPDALHLAEIRADGVRTHRLPAAQPGEVAVGAAPGGALVAWMQGREAFLLRIGPGGEADAPLALDLGPAWGGTLAVIPGPEPLVWAQRGTTRGDEPPEWTSALAVPGHPPVLVDEMVFAVAAWGRRVAVVCAGEILLLERVGDDRARLSG